MEKLIELYKEWMKQKSLPYKTAGLCGALRIAGGEYYETFDNLLSATIPERKDQEKEGFDFTYWASGLRSDHPDEINGFTPLRQTIVLLICAMHDEL